MACVRSEDNLNEFTFSFYLVVSWDPTELVLRFGGKLLCHLSHLDGPFAFFEAGLELVMQSMMNLNLISCGSPQA